ncbi:unnamed protein product [Brachionus calyciflorus]|uniref:Laminin EGF-like domain-containing protein n=1 Tax=Brachionus calyciflorus TaxID=104777 RepID=A0A814AL02_9BILA|nr:unnamed protein product [Brachionus calyciflorus]
MSLKLIYLLILNTIIINIRTCINLEEEEFSTPFVSSSSSFDNFDYEIGDKFESKSQIECKSDLNCKDSNSVCQNGYCVKLCSYSDRFKLISKNCVYYHCDSKQYISSSFGDLNNQNSIPIETNNYPVLNRYLSKKKCSWILQNKNYINKTNENSFIQLNFERFSTQFFNDYLYIFAGDSIYSPLLAALSGTDSFSTNPSENKIQQNKLQSNSPTISLTFFNVTSLFLFFKTDVLSSHSLYKSIYLFDDAKPNGISVKHKFSSSCDGFNLSESDPSSICFNELNLTKNYCENETECTSDLIENLKYKNPDSLDLLNTRLNRAYHCSFVFENYFYILGGFSFSKKLSFLSRLNLMSLLWEHDIDRTSSTIVNRSNRNFFANISNFEKPKLELPGHRYSQSCALDNDNKRVYMFGGILYDAENNEEYGSKRTTNELWVLNLETNKWSLLNDDSVQSSFKESKKYECPIAVSGHSMHLINKGSNEQSLFIFFGYSEYYGSTLNIIQEYNLVSKVWTYNQTSFLNIGHGHSSVYDNRTNLIYFHGGLVLNQDKYSNSRNSQSSLISSFIYSFSLIGYTWTELTKSSESSYMQSSILYNNKILFYGGITQTDDYQKILYNSNRLQFYETIKNEFVHEFTLNDTRQKFEIKNSQRYAHTSFIYENNMYIFGGFNGFFLSDMLKIDLKKIPEIQKIDASFRKKRQNYKETEIGDSFGNRTNKINSPKADIDFVSKYEIPSEFSNRQLSYSEYCFNHKTCNLCQMDSNCVWNGKYCDYFVSSNSSLKQLYKKPSCTQMCSEFTSCTNCTSLININGQYQNNCVWCASQSKCVQKKAISILYPFGECFNLINDREQCDREITQEQTGAKININTCSLLYSNCSSCITDERCGWCTKDSLDSSSLNTGYGICIEGGEKSSLNNQCKLKWFFSNCPQCECNGHSVCSNTSTCSKCMNNTQGEYCSECRSGYFGKPKNNGECRSCECGQQASDCDNNTGKCYCNTKGVVGLKCELCDSPRYNGRPNTTDGTCYYNLTTDYQFTFNLNKDSDRYYTKINFVNHPMRDNDDDIDFMVRCFKSTALFNVSYVVEDFSDSSYDSFVVPDYNQNPLPIEFLDNLTLAFNSFTYSQAYSLAPTLSYQIDNSAYYFGPLSRYTTILDSINCSSGEFKYTFSNRELNYADKNRNLIFIVNVYDFQTPITIQIAFSRKSKIQLLHFFITFFGCLLSLLTIAFITWKSKQRFDRYRRQRQIVIQMEQMASRPFTRLLLDITENSKENLLEMKIDKDELLKDRKNIRRSLKKNDKKSKFFKGSEVENNIGEKNDYSLKVMPIGVEPLSNNKSAIVTCLLRLPQGGQNGIPKGSSLFMLGSTYVNLNSSSSLIANNTLTNGQHLIDEESELDNQAGKTVNS